MSAPSSRGVKRQRSDSGGKGESRKIGPDHHADQHSSSSKGGKGQEKSQVADYKGEGGMGSKTSGIQADATINAMFRTCSRNV